MWVFYCQCCLSLVFMSFPAEWVSENRGEEKCIFSFWRPIELVTNHGAFYVKYLGIVDLGSHKQNM